MSTDSHQAGDAASGGDPAVTVCSPPRISTDNVDVWSVGAQGTPTNYIVPRPSGTATLLLVTATSTGCAVSWSVEPALVCGNKGVLPKS